MQCLKLNGLITVLRAQAATLGGRARQGVGVDRC